jgi:transcriptional regulator with XRE-family HTH domain
VDNLRFQGARSAARIDNAVGDRIRKRRMLLGYTQEQLADALEISYQQIQKYETGANRVSAGRLFQIAQRLEAPIGYFFEGLGLEFDEEVAGGQSLGGSNRTTIEVVRNLSQIGDSQVRSALAALVKALANTGQDMDDDQDGDDGFRQMMNDNGHPSQHSQDHGHENGHSHGNGHGNGHSDRHGTED